MKTTDQQARQAIDQAAALIGWTVTTPPPLYKDDPPAGPLPVYVTDPATGRSLHLRRLTYPASVAGRLSISPRWPEGEHGRTYNARTATKSATVADDTQPAPLARRLTRYMDETTDAYTEAVTIRDSWNTHAATQAATIAALVAAGWREPSRHAPASPSFPDLPGHAYARGEQVSGELVRFDLNGLTAAQAIAVSRLLTTGDPADPLAAVRRLVDIAAAQLDQSATHDGLTNADAIAAARRLL